MDKNPAECIHDYCHESTHYQKREGGYRRYKYTRCDVYFCRKCLEKKELNREEVVYSDDPMPIWWQH